MMIVIMNIMRYLFYIANCGGASILTIRGYGNRAFPFVREKLEINGEEKLVHVLHAADYEEFNNFANLIYRGQSPRKIVPFIGKVAPIKKKDVPKKGEKKSTDDPEAQDEVKEHNDDDEVESPAEFLAKSGKGKVAKGGK